MYCKNCGNKLRENSKFCGKCGKKVEIEEEENKKIVEATFKEKEEMKNEKEPKEEKKVEKEPSKEEKMYCRYCGKEIAADSRICPNCGYNLINRTSNSDPFTNFIICVVSFIIPIIGFILWLVMKSENNSKAKNALIAACLGIVTGFLLVLLVILFVIIALIA